MMKKEIFLVGIFVLVVIFYGVNIFAGGEVSPLITWKDIYGREDSGRRSTVSVALGIDSRGGGTRYSVRGKYSMIEGEYHGAWAKFEEWKIIWNYNRVCQLSTKKEYDKGWYTKGNGKWEKEDIPLYYRLKRVFP